MARCTLVEYGKLYAASGVPYPFPDEDTWLAEQAETSFASSTQFNAFNANTGWILVSTDTAVHFRLGVNPTATNAGAILPANQSLLIPVGRKPATKTLAIIASA
jgi:hypothetical protein